MACARLATGPARKDRLSPPRRRFFMCPRSYRHNRPRASAPRLDRRDAALERHAKARSPDCWRQIGPTTGTLRAFSTLACVTLPTINFRSIREHEGTKHRGFEELVFQLIPWIDKEVAGREVVRHGSPDGGVEAHVKFDDGSIRGWQAKYFFSTGASQLQQMKESFHAALEAHPTLSSYTFVVPFNPPSGKSNRGRSARQKVDVVPRDVHRAPSTV